MADQNQKKFAPPPQNIIIRTLEKDLEALRTGGGSVSSPPPQEVRTPQPGPEEAFLYEQVPHAEPSPPSIPQPPTLEPAPAPPPPPRAPLPQETVAVPPPEGRGEKSKVFSGVLIAFFVVLAIAALGAPGYFFLWPRIAGLFKPSPSPRATLPSPSPTLSPSPSPSPINPSILFRSPPGSEKEILLPEKTSDALLLSLSAERAEKETEGTMKALSFRGPDGQYLTGEEFITLLIHNPYPSFTAAAGKKYLPFFYFGKVNTYFGFALEIKPEAKESVEELLKSWEGASIDQDFALVFLGDEPGKRKTTTFRQISSGGLLVREVQYQNDALSLAYTFSQNILLVATHRDAIFAVAKKL